MKVIKCGILSLKLIYLVIAPICNALSYFFALLITTNDSNVTFCCLSQIFFVFFCVMCGGLTWIYILITNKRKRKIIQTKTKIDLTSNQFEVILPEDEKPKTSSGVNLIIVSMTIMFFFQNMIQSYMTFTYEQIILDPNKGQSNLKFELFTVHSLYIILLSYYILHYRVCLHQFVSLIIIVIGMMLILFRNIIEEEYLEIRLPVYCLEYLLSSIRYVLEKYLIEKTICIPILNIIFWGCDWIGFMSANR